MATFLAVIGGLMLVVFILATCINWAALRRDLKSATKLAEVAMEVAKSASRGNDEQFSALSERCTAIARYVDTVVVSLADLRKEFRAHVAEVGETIEYIGTDVRERTLAFQDRMQVLEQSLNKCTDAASVRIQALSDELRRTRNECVACVICDAPEPESATLAPRRTTKKAAKKKAQR